MKPETAINSLTGNGLIVYAKSKKIYGCYEWLQPSLPFGDNKDTAELTVGEGRETRRCSKAGRIVLYPQGTQQSFLLLFIEGIMVMKNLQDLQQYYEQTLCDRIFRYSLTNGSVIDVIFYREAFCHLLGIQHITKNRRFIGQSGYYRIQSGKLTVGTLKGMNRASFGKVKHRMEYFNLIGHLMEQGDLFRFYPERAGRTRIQATFLIHQEERELYLHLFLAKESPKSNIYAPMSYIVLTERDDNPKLYIEGQEHKKVIKLEILPMNPQISYKDNFL